MDIRPFDVQMFISKSADNSKINNDALKYNEIYQNLSDEFKKNFENENKRTNKLNETEKEGIDKNKKNNENYYKNEKKYSKKNKKNKKIKKDESKKESSGIFDVTI